jgi:hypothetical protein
MCIVSLRDPCKKALHTSICLIGQPYETARDKTTRIVIGLITEL